MLVDPSLALRTTAPRADAVIVSHAHEDHIVGLPGYGLEVHAHVEDLAAVRSREVLLAGYGLPPGEAEAFDRSLSTEFEVGDVPGARGFADGHRFDLGDRTVTVVHLPGHTPGHCGLWIEPDGFLYIADIDLSSFGPFYGDVGASLDRFESSMRRCADIEARWYGTYHHKGVIDGPGEFRRRLGEYRGVIATRDARLLAFLTEPRTVEQIAEHRLVYRPHVDAPYVMAVERRTAQRHLARLEAAGGVEEIEPGRYRAASG